MPAPTQPPDLDPRTDATFAAQALVRARLADVRREEQVLRDGPTPDGVHDLRVAVRRLRAALRLFGAEHEPAEACEREAKVLQDALGAVRDLHIRREWLEKLRETDAPSAPGASAWLDELGPQLAQTEDALAGALRRWHTATARLDGALLVPELPGRIGAASLRRPLRDALRKLEKRLSRLDAEVLPHDAHLARIAAKKARYLAELLSAGAPDLLEPVREAVVPLQTLAGDLHDLDVKRDELARRSEAHPGRAARLAPIDRKLAEERDAKARELHGLVERWRAEDLLPRLRRLLK